MVVLPLGGVLGLVMPCGLLLEDNDGLGLGMDMVMGDPLWRSRGS